MFRWLEIFRRVDGRRRVLFVCLGNSCRSPMAEAFARVFGDDILIARSAGLMPSEAISTLSRRVMQERNVPIRKRAPRLLSRYNLAEFDLVVNMTGHPLTFAHTGAVVEWNVADPAGMKLASHRAVRDSIEALLRNLVENLRFREGFAPRRDVAQSARARAAFRLILLAALIAGPLSATPLYEAPADYTGARAAGDLVTLGGPGGNVWICWEVDAISNGWFHYQYEFGGPRLGLWMFNIETEAPGAALFDASFDGGLVRRHNVVSFYSRGAPVWGNFALSGGMTALVLNEGWFHPDSPLARDFIARPGSPDEVDTTEPSMAAPLLVVLAAAFFVHRTRRRLVPPSPAS